MRVHDKAMKPLEARAVRLPPADWKRLEALQLDRGDKNVQVTIRSVVAEYLRSYEATRAAA